MPTLSPGVATCWHLEALDPLFPGESRRKKVAMPKHTKLQSRALSVRVFDRESDTSSFMVAIVPSVLGPMYFFADALPDKEVSVTTVGLFAVCLMWPLFAMFQHEKAQEGVADIASIDRRSHYSIERL